MAESNLHFPFSALVGQEKLKSAYLANLVNPRIGGLLISGPKGTGKSTMVHSIAGLLPAIEVVEGCPFHCDPAAPASYCSLCRDRKEIRATTSEMRIFTLPLSCTEDRLIGSINVEKLLSEGIREVEPGILGQANRNILYVDEVNLLPDHLVDDILDAAASHWSAIEREGVSLSHPAEFVLVGSMNPEEGELRPQILDRFPLCARLETIREPAQRVEIIRRNLLFERDPAAFVGHFAQEEAELKRILHQARVQAGRIGLEERWLVVIASACAALKVDGQRPDIVIVKTAQAIAALAGREALQPEDVLMAADLALNHRTRDGGLLDPPTTEEIVDAFRKEMRPAGVADAPAADGIRLDKVEKRVGEFVRSDGSPGGPPDRTAGAAPPGGAGKKG
jgi:Mg-chelatase subunit ChlI